MMSVRWGAATDTGRVRPGNEDSFLAGASVFVVADGMGGHAAGEVASALAVQPFATLDEQPARRPEDVVAAVAAANQLILDTADAQGLPGMGTTLTGLIAVDSDSGPRWAVVNVGDSRVYQWSRGELRQLTVDHSEVQELISIGQLTVEQAKVHPARNVVTRSLGSDPAPAPDVWLVPPAAGEVFLLCSDGLNREIPDDAIARLLSGCPDPEQAAAALVEAAVLAGGRDNVTVIVVEVRDEAAA